MEAYVLDWANLLLRWAHIITGIAWIGSSFYFVSLDNSLTPPKDAKDAAKGVGGEQWGVHGGGFYHHQKYPVSPGYVPEQLHWSMWESYSTWLTGFALFTVLYLYNASTFLIDKTLFDWTPTAAICTALAFFVAFWVLYDTICRTLGRGKHGDEIVGGCVFVLIVLASWLSCHLFAGRAAFLLVGAMIATTMSGNVFFWIIPGQRTVVAAIKAGAAVDPVHGQRGKQRSVHNTFFTLPVLFSMMSNHYGFTYGARYNWLVLVAIMVAGALIRMSFALRHRALADGRPVPWHFAGIGSALLLGVIVATAPAPQAPQAAAAPASFAEVQAIVAQRCVLCHGPAMQSKNLRFDSPDEITRHAQQIYQQAVVLKLMPMNNATQITDAERALIGRWFTAGAPTK
ncbi:MAG TPA: urate hydroxylase PuuD [Burkholderiaceae bacterium]|nr:urate hydroxylase PuuD [Burkholderiaceae bacterium]